MVKIHLHVDLHSRKSKGCMREKENRMERRNIGEIKYLFYWCVDWFITRWFMLKMYFLGHSALLSADRLAAKNIQGGEKVPGVTWVLLLVMFKLTGSYFTFNTIATPVYLVSHLWTWYRRARWILRVTGSVHTIDSVEISLLGWICNSV